MARKPKEPKVPPPPPTRDEQIATAEANFFGQFKVTQPELIAKPTRIFDVGDAVQVGGLTNCVVAKVLLNGKGYVVEYTSSSRDIAAHQAFGTWWWVDVEYPRKADDPNDRLFQKGWRGGAITSAIDSILHLYTSDGLVCNPDYQRGYVWSEFDREQLLDSIFDRMDIGMFVLVRNEGYNHEGDKTPMKYLTITGEPVEIPRCENYCVEIIDGQQRLTTIIRFMLDQFTHRGRYFSQLSFSDRIEFERYGIQYRLLREEETSRKEILEMFLKVNRGVPQTNEHLDKVRKLLKDMP